MKRFFLHVPAVIAGLLIGWLISSRIGQPDPSAPSKARVAEGAAEKEKGWPSSPGSLAAFKKLVDARTPPPVAPPNQLAVVMRLGEISKANGHSPVRAALESEVLRSVLPTDMASGNFLLNVNPEGSPGAAQLLERWTKKYPVYALAETGRQLSQARKTEQETSVLRRHIFREWLRNDPQGALKAATDSYSAYTRGLNVQALMSEWSRLDPLAAAAALTKLPEGGPGFERKDFAETLFRGWSASDHAAARAWVESQPDPVLRESLTVLDAELSAPTPAAKVDVLLAAKQRDAGRIADAFTGWFTADPAAAASKLSAIPPGDIFWTKDAAAITERWALDAPGGTSPGDLLKPFDSIPAGPERDAILKGLAGYGAVKDIPFAVRVVEEMGEGPARSEAMTGLTERWMSRDPLALSEWLNTLPPGESRHAAVSRFAGLLVKSDPEAAARWAETLPDNFPGKENLVRRIAEKTALDGPGKAPASKP
jgi:hypothetical protein